MFLVESRQECVKRDFKKGSVVCVCNATLCDDLDPIKKTSKGVVTVFQSSNDGDRFKQIQMKFGDKVGKANKAQTIVIDRSKTCQKIVGFGGAFTDSVGINIKSLPDKLQQRLIEGYFSERGLEYTLVASRSLPVIIRLKPTPTTIRIRMIMFNFWQNSMIKTYLFTHFNLNEIIYYLTN